MADISTPVDSMQGADNFDISELTDPSNHGESDIDDGVSTPDKDTKPDDIDETAENDDNIKNEVNGEKRKEKKDNKGKDKLIAGKFKNIEELEKAYLEEQKLINKKAEESNQYKKELEIYRKQQEEAKLRKEVEAKQRGFANLEEQQIANEINQYELNLFAQALEEGYAGENYDSALKALQAYHNSGDPKALELAEMFFTPKALKTIAENKLAFKNQKFQALQQKQTENNYNTAKANLEKFAKDTGDWLNDSVRQQIVVEQLKLFGANTDLYKIKTLIDKIESNAIEKEQLKQKANSEQDERLKQMQGPADTSQGKIVNGIDWKTAKSSTELEKLLYGK